MSINYQSFSFAQNANDTSSSSLTPAAPSGTVAGDLLVSFLVTGTPAIVPNMNAPAGWTVAIEDETSGPNACHNQIAFKIATGTDDLTFTYAAITAKVRVEVYRFTGDFNTSNPISVIGAYYRANAQNFVAPSVTSIADNSKLLSFCCTKNAVLAAENSATPPTGMTLIHSTNIGTAFSPAKMAIAGQDISTVSATGARTWSAFDSSSRYGLAVNIFINGPAITIDTINGDGSNPDIDVTASNTATTTGLGTITATTFTDASGFVSTATPTMPSGDGSFVFSWPWADGTQQAKFGSVTASVTDGTLTATLPSNMPLPTDYSSTTWSGATDLGEFYLGHYETLTNDNKVYYPTVVDGATVTINADGWMSFSSLPVTVPLLLHDCRSGGTGSITTKTLIVTESGAVVVDTTPDAFTFGSVTGVELTTVTEGSVQAVIEGVAADTDIEATPSGGLECRVSSDEGVTFGSWTDEPFNVQLGYVVEGRILSPGSHETLVTGSLTIGSTVGTLSVTTRASSDIPDPLVFASFTNSELLTEHTSSTQTVTGLDSGESSAFTVANGTYSKNGGAFISTPGTMEPDDTFALCGTSDEYFGRSKTVTLTATNGSVESTFTIVNKLDPLLPAGIGGNSQLSGRKITGRKI